MGAAGVAAVVYGQCCLVPEVFILCHAFTEMVAPVLPKVLLIKSSNTCFSLGMGCVPHSGGKSRGSYLIDPGD